MSNKALGKGLSALIPEKLQDKNLSEVGVLDIEKISNNSQQPRTNYDAQRLKELVASIKEKGVLQPIVVRPQGEGYEVIAGERRLRAARTLNFKEVPVVIKEVSDQEALVISIVENIQREELNPIEEAEAYKKLIENFQFTQ
ncbi:Chromosome (plasmid) partitioning protein ParB, partial [hydrothermal vent metagenome]